ncbi:hypothetical protein VMCG_09056 [Cytospora schulzeri]|uniref:Uncharacterized protein n=1 Tax=Cytospora schulzeri TaxID=448051 RepID=A0A423VP23_9PEZI|nr:hypothetical protein VMCG_09056 [Valsa malicola]
MPWPAWQWKTRTTLKDKDKDKDEDVIVLRQARDDADWAESENLGGIITVAARVPVVATVKAVPTKLYAAASGPG